MLAKDADGQSILTFLLSKRKARRCESFVSLEKHPWAIVKYDQGEEESPVSAVALAMQRAALKAPPRFHTFSPAPHKFVGAWKATSQETAPPVVTCYPTFHDNLTFLAT